ncbi:DUF1294 domain-containing protein [Acinetobacter sp. c3-l95]|uniref:DUF1294 domain-containing protein n=1 Tax=Acinetobacter sp. c3-l95 TaxID=3342804 RepID=UPI0035B97E3F
MARYQGRLIEWHDDKGYGFVETLGESKDSVKSRVFLHIKNFERQGPRPIVGCVVDYELSIDSQSRPQAVKVRYVKANQVRQSNATKNSPPINNVTSIHGKTWLRPAYIAMAVYWVSVLVLAFYHLLPPFTILSLSLINSYSYWLYHKDKQAAMSGIQRVPEQHLLLCAVLGGWSASLLAQQHFHHKTVKQPFQRHFQLASVAHCLLLMASIAIYAVW